jgi:hypothetical protein
MSIALQRPNDARARPSSLLKRDTDYETVFNRDYPIALYWVCATLMKLVDKEVRSEKHGLAQKDQTNIRFYAAMYVACLTVEKANPNPSEIAAISVSSITDAVKSEALDRVCSSYKELGASDQSAKGVELTARLKSALQERFPSAPNRAG